MAEWVQERGVDSLPNAVFVKPDEYFSSYEMIQRAKFVMIYNSTIGMEAAIMGAPTCATTPSASRQTQRPVLAMAE